MSPARAFVVVIGLASCFTSGLAGCTGLEDDPTSSQSEPGPWQAPQNQWPSTVPPSNLEDDARKLGFEEGQRLPDLRLGDQNGDEVALWQLYDRVVLVSISAIWCLPCRDVAEEAEVLGSEYPELVHVSV